jgi:hypothetical protein
MKYFIRYQIDKNGITEIKVPRKQALKEINALVKKDREMLKILEKL